MAGDGGHEIRQQRTLWLSRGDSDGACMIIPFFSTENLKLLVIFPVVKLHSD